MSYPLPLVLVPGLTCDAAAWAPLAGSLRGVDVKMFNHDLADSLGGMAERVLREMPERFAIAGHSMGGRIALEVLARAPARVARVALLDTGFEALAPGAAGEREREGRMRLLEIARRDGMRTMARAWARGMVHPDRLGDVELMTTIHDMLGRASSDMFAAQIRALLARPDRTALLGAINVPTLVLCGHEDSWSPIARHRDMARRIPGSVLVDVPRCGHMCTLEQPGIVGEALRRWLHDEPQPHAADPHAPDEPA